MLQRMNAYVENQNFCLFERQPSKWPPPEAVSYFLGENGMSCKDVCSQKGRFIKVKILLFKSLPVI